VIRKLSAILCVLLLFYIIIIRLPGWIVGFYVWEHELTRLYAEYARGVAESLGSNVALEDSTFTVAGDRHVVVLVSCTSLVIQVMVSLCAVLCVFSILLMIRGKNPSPSTLVVAFFLILIFALIINVIRLGVILHLYNVNPTWTGLEWESLHNTTTLLTFFLVPGLSALMATLYGYITK